MTDWTLRIEIAGNKEPADIHYATAASARNAYTVIANADHPKVAKLVLIDPEGRVEAMWPPRSLRSYAITDRNAWE